MAINFPEGTINQPGFIEAGFTNLSGSSTVDFTGIPSHARYIRVGFFDMSTTGSGAYRLRLRVGEGGVSSSSYWYINGHDGGNSGRVNNTNQSYWALTNTTHTGNNHYESGIIDLMRQGSAGWVIKWQGCDHNSSLLWDGAGSWRSNSPINEVRLISGHGAFSGGSASCQYI